MKIVGIIQARLHADSDRLMLKKAGDITLFEVMLKRFKMSRFIQNFVLSTTDEGYNTPLKEIAKKEGVDLFTTKDGDLLKRIIDSAHSKGADIVVRIGGNAPLIDPYLTDRLIERHIEKESDFTYAEGFPKGIVYDVVNLDVIKKIYKPFFNTRYQSFILNNKYAFKIESLQSNTYHEDIDLLLKNYINLKLINAVIHSYPLIDFRCSDILYVLPDILIRLIEDADSIIEKRYYNKQLNLLEAAERAAIQRSFPTSIRMDIHNLCNLKCRTCAHSMAGKKKNHKTAIDLRTDTIRKDENGVYINTSNPLNVSMYKGLADSFFPFVEDICFGWLGEPFMSKERDLEYILNTNKQFNIKTYFITNGMLLNQRLIKFIISHDVHGITLSIDSLDSKKFENIRKGAELKSLIDNIRLINDIKKEMGTDIPHICLSFTMAIDNIEELPDIIVFAKNMDINTVFAQYRFIMSFMDPKESLFFYPEKREKYFLLSKKIAHENNITLRLQDVSIFEKHGYCTLPWKSVFISSMGDVTPCCSILKPLGRLYLQSFPSIWNNAAYKQFRNSLKQNFNMPYECINCGIECRPENIRNFLEDVHCI